MTECRIVRAFVSDQFAHPLPPGKVIGSLTTAGYRRLGTDRARRLAIDHEALRIRFPHRAGWGRQGLAYGPFRRQAGLTLAVSLLNGHHGSQTDARPQPAWSRVLRRWLRTFNQALGVSQIRPHPPGVYASPRLTENLAVGFYPAPRPDNPCHVGGGLVMRSADSENGELCARTDSRLLPVVRGVQNLPLQLMIVLREQGAAYYAASLAGAAGLGEPAALRPLAIDLQDDAEEVYAGLWQSVLGEIGFQVDTRVYGVHIEILPEFAPWYGTAQVADRLVGLGPFAGGVAETGQRWTCSPANFTRETHGATLHGDNQLALLTSPTPVGLLHLQIEIDSREFTTEASPALGVAWRAADADNHWLLRFDSHGGQVGLHEAGRTEVLLRTPRTPLRESGRHALQILDDGDEMRWVLNGQPLFDRPLRDARLSGHPSAGLWVAGLNGAARFRDFELHPRSIPLPANIVWKPYWSPPPLRVVVQEDFEGPPGELAGRASGDATWRREIGGGRFHLTGDGALRVDASLAQPNPGRTTYTIAWSEPRLADLRVELTPPGTDRGKGERGRGGLILWQDPCHFLIANLWQDDAYSGASISTFLTYGGRENLFRAVWTNVGRRVQWGQPFDLRLASDGLYYLLHVDEEPVLYRAITDIEPRATPLRIRRVGLVANWEWGNDTGTQFRKFIARGAALGEAAADRAVLAGRAVE